jgi:hypothetical protein
VAKSKKWEKEAFMRAFYAESGTKHFKGKDEEKNWSSFYGAMAKHCKTAGAGELDAIRLMMRCGAVNKQLENAKLAKWAFPARPKSTPPKPPSVADIAKAILAENS